ncbi:hypothetical protein [Aminobacter niigataensis]|uniref:hypothetical protein n=1 Tax=Aminobacter niigataensis TaxID=83265 RepID=UPI0024CBD34F|nr:hypothetical protein [Aminobacter niigataensis]CAI2932840.1 conserved membrane protein of unknown function [Aminobacter niigataensis]
MNDRIIGLAHSGPWHGGAVLKGVAVTILSFAALGTVSALWDNPLFVRMTPVAGWELPALVVLSALSGLYVAVRRPVCSVRRAGIGGVAGFIGIACPTCNKILMLLFGGEFLMMWFDPIRPLISALGIAFLTAASWREIRARRVDAAMQPEYLQ